MQCEADASLNVIEEAENAERRTQNASLPALALDLEPDHDFAKRRLPMGGCNNKNPAYESAGGWPLATVTVTIERRATSMHMVDGLRLRGEEGEGEGDGGKAKAKAKSPCLSLS
ncbi:hypothetical protein GSI_05807 [Ganoderma sinense ZZ0214-1]|uniref:Uncharacterized protein n=1 Tax=Ganoderma sinense ZZ0214-1 TaxID=1077348 RepID=A0A2G8SBI4_9APHY|nr:hypothetical protein GSI_05807 [Ganoderma sinense ZZ0214-1]